MHYEEMLDKFYELKKIASEDDFEQECANILKEAGLGSLAVRAGKWAIKNPGKAFGAATSGLVLGGAAKQGLQAAKQELNPNMQSTQMQPIQPISKSPKPRFGEEKMAKEDDEKNDIGAYKYLPHAAGAAMLGLGVAEAVKKKDPMAPIKSIKQGVKEMFPKIIGNKLKKTPIGRVGQNAVRKAGKKINDEAFKAYQQGQSFRKSKGKFNKPIDQDKGILKKIKKHTPGIDQLNKGFGAGVTFGLANFLMHSAGDEYFKRKDKDELRRRMRESYQDDISDPRKMKKLITNTENWAKNTYKTPKQRVTETQKRKKYHKDRIYKKAGIDIGSIEKSAMDRKKVIDTTKDIVKNDILRNARRSLIYSTAPILAGQAINKNLKFDGGKLRPRDSNENPSNRIVVEIPLDEANTKKANVIDKIAADKTKVINKIKSSMADDARQAIRAISWAAAPTAVIALTGRNVRGNFEKMNKNNQLAPVEPGKARIIIETNKGGENAHSNSGYYAASGYSRSGMSRRASEELDVLYKEAISQNDIQRDINEIASPKEDVKDKAKATQKLTNIKLFQGIKKKERLRD